MKRYHRPSRAVLKSKRWPALRIRALRRDGWRCVQCGNRTALEVDHVEAVRDRPDLAFELDNLQTLCRWCHSSKTRKELGFPEADPERQRWQALLRDCTNI